MPIERKEFLTEQESDGLLRLLRDSAALLKQTGEFSSVRRDIKTRLVHQAEEIDFWLRRRKDTMAIDAGVIRALERIADERRTSFVQEVGTALEMYITHYNRRR